MSVWKQGITGKGVVVTILDDGKDCLRIEISHAKSLINVD